jgi:hypothetical protein
MGHVESLACRAPDDSFCSLRRFAASLLSRCDFDDLSERIARHTHQKGRGFFLLSATVQKQVPPPRRIDISRRRRIDVAHDVQTIAAWLRAAGLCPVDLHALQRAAIRNALEHADGNRTRAAKTLGISVRTLQRTIKAWTTQEVSMNGNGHSDGDGQPKGQPHHDGDGQPRSDGQRRTDGRSQPKRHGHSDGDVFLAAIGGRRVECRTIEDAIGVKSADVLIRTGEACSLAELERLIAILKRYGCTEAASRLSQQRVRQHAAEFLSNSVGYRRPMRSRPVQ